MTEEQKSLVEMVESHLPVTEKDKANAEYLNSREMAFRHAMEGNRDLTLSEIAYAEQCRT